MTCCTKYKLTSLGESIYSGAFYAHILKPLYGLQISYSRFIIYDLKINPNSIHFHVRFRDLSCSAESESFHETAELAEVDAQRNLSIFIAELLR